MVVVDCNYVDAGYRLIALARAGRFKGERTMFLHTGGAEGLFRLSWRAGAYVRG
jgi:L-cysteate sulfo-lyase